MSALVFLPKSSFGKPDLLQSWAISATLERFAFSYRSPFNGMSGMYNVRLECQHSFFEAEWSKLSKFSNALLNLLND